MSEIIHRFVAKAGDMHPGPNNAVGTQAWLWAILDPYTNPWHCYVEVVENYLPPFPGTDTKPEIQVRWGESFLRQGRGPFHPFFWDVYGDKFYTVQHAWLAVSQAPTPPRLGYRNSGNPEGL